MIREAGMLLSRMAAPIKARVDAMIEAVRVEETDGREVTVTTHDDDDKDEVVHATPAGLYFRPVVGAEGYALQVGGRAEHRVMIGATPTDAPAVDTEGEGGLYLDGLFRVYLAADGTVHLGEQDAADFVALAQKVLDELTAIKTYIDAHVHAGVTTGSGSTGAPASPMPSPSSVAATKVKAT